MKNEIFVLLGIGIVLFLVMRKPQNPVEPEPSAPEYVIPAQTIFYGGTPLRFLSGEYTIYVDVGSFTRAPLLNSLHGTLCFHPYSVGHSRCIDY